MEFQENHNKEVCQERQLEQKTTQIEKLTQKIEDQSKELELLNLRLLKLEAGEP